MSLGQWVNIVASIALGLAIASLIQNHSQADQLEQLKTDRATVQQQIASEQARTRQLEATLEQMLANQASTSASVTIPTCTLHEIYEQTAHC